MTVSQGAGGVGWGARAFKAARAAGRHLGFLLRGDEKSREGVKAEVSYTFKKISPAAPWAGWGGTSRLHGPNCNFRYRQ